MKTQDSKLICKALNAKQIIETQVIQSLWSGYGQILRIEAIGSAISSAVIKRVQLPKKSAHPRGWDTDLSHQRKLKSYDVETAFYRHWAPRCDEYCRVAQCYAAIKQEQTWLMVLEDLDASGYSKRIESPDLKQIKNGLDWLANFHAQFMGSNAKDLWHEGTYWHLDTRPDELAALADLDLKRAAEPIASRLANAKYQTLVHGDAKLANFCFSNNDEVAAVDFQYVGHGCGMKDVVYFLGSCLDDQQLETHCNRLIDHYFEALNSALGRLNSSVDGLLIEREWRSLCAFAWADFQRFLLGWSPSHWKLNAYSDTQTQTALSTLRREASR